MSRTRLLQTLDSLALGGLLAGILILLAGGLSVRFNDVRLTARTPHRAFIVFAAILLVRLAVDRRTGPWGARQGWWRRARHGFDDPLADAVTPLPRGAALARRVNAAVSIIVLSGVLFHGQLTRMDSVPDLGDPLFSIWRLGWVYHQLQGASAPSSTRTSSTRHGTRWRTPIRCSFRHSRRCPSSPPACTPS